MQAVFCFIKHSLFQGGCGSVGRAGGLVMSRSLVQAPLSGTEVHVEVSLKTQVAPDVQMAPCVAATAISKGPAMSCQLIQGVPLIQQCRATLTDKQKDNEMKGKQK